MYLFFGLQGESPENGEFSWIRLETFGNSRPKKFERRSPETIGDEKSPTLAGLSATKEGNSPKRGLPGWRHSADRTRLQANSLLTGNFTGILRFRGSLDRFRSKKPLRRSHFSRNSLRKLTGKIFQRTGNFFAGIREFRVTVTDCAWRHGRKRQFLARFVVGGSAKQTNGRYFGRPMRPDRASPR